jgi:hypothetical protein
MMAAPYAVDAVEKAVKAPAPAQAPAPAPAVAPPTNVPKQNPNSARNPIGVHYILVGETGKVFANKYGSKSLAEKEAHEIYKRSGIVVNVVYPDEGVKRGVKRVGTVIREL